MFKKTPLASVIGSIAVTSALAAAGVALPAYAEEAEDQAMEEVIVTGSRIKTSNLSGSNPVTVLDREYLTNVGQTSLGDILQDIPSSAGAALNTGVNNGGSGAVRFSLRGLGSERTLVMLNGKRVVASGLGANASVDLNNIPISMIERVEILKDGASAIYGSDAVSGVVNMITRNDFEGLDLNAYTGRTSEGDGDTDMIDITMGVNGDRGNVVVSAFYVNQLPIWAGDREYSKQEIWYHPYWDPTGQATGGSSAPPWGNFNTADGRVTHGPEFLSGYRPYSGATDPYNYAPANYSQTPSERWGASAFSSLELGDYGILGTVTATAEGFFSHRESQRLIAPEPLAPLVFFGSPAPISQLNYYNITQGPQDLLGNPYTIDDWRRRMVETGGRDQHHTSNTYQLNVGFDGSFGDDWTWELSAAYGENRGNVLDEGYFNLDRVAEAVGPTFFDGAGDLKCGTSVLDEIDGCVPLNPFGIPGTATAITPEMLGYISNNYLSMSQGGNELKTVGFSVSGDLAEIPTGTIGLAAGYEKRWHRGFFQPDSLQITGVSTAGTSLSTSGQYSVNDAYVELAIPVVQDAVEISIAARVSDYSTYGNTTTTKLGVRWDVFDGFVVRATVSEAFRAPSVPELFGGDFTSYPEAVDPCATDPSPSCVADGVPLVGYDNTGLVQLPTQYGGSPALEAEEADILTFGVIYEPSWLEGSSLTIDYWKTELTNTISTNGPQVILDNCHATGLNCDLIDRFGPGSSEGNIIIIRNLNDNVGALDASGVDIAVNYDMDTSIGNFRFGFDAAYSDEYDKTLSNGNVVSHSGRLEDNQDGNFPRWKWNFNTRWTYTEWEVAYTIRYIHEVDETLNKWFNIDPVFFEPTNEQHTVDSTMVHDIQVSYNLREYNTRLTLGFDNITDEDPPFAYSAFNDNTDVRTYDTKGRYMYARIGFSL